MNDDICKVEMLPKNGFFQLFPGVYCRTCGKTFALYSYSAHQPDGVDESGRAFYKTCLMCDKL
jgi:hypothetical protein